MHGGAGPCLIAKWEQEEATMRPASPPHDPLISNPGAPYHERAGALLGEREEEHRAAEEAILGYRRREDVQQEGHARLPAPHAPATPPLGHAKADVVHAAKNAALELRDQDAASPDPRERDMRQVEARGKSDIKPGETEVGRDLSIKKQANGNPSV